MSMASISRSAFSRTGTNLIMKPGVTTLSVGTIDITGITIDDDYSINVDTTAESPTQHQLQFTNGNGTRTISFIEDIISGGLIKPELMPDRALTQVYSPAGTTELLALDPIQIGDIAIKGDDNFVYIAKNGDNEDIGDWQVLALASSHPSYEFVTGDKGALDGLVTNTSNHFSSDTNPHSTNLSNLTSVIGGYTYSPNTTDKDEVGVANVTPSSQKRMNKIVSKEYSFGFTATTENKIPNEDWTHVYSFLTTGAGNSEYTIARLSDVPGGSTENVTPTFEGNESNEGGYETSGSEDRNIGGGIIQVGSSELSVDQGADLGTIEFYTKDSSLTSIDPDDDGGTTNSVIIPSHVSAKITAQAEIDFTNPQSSQIGSLISGLTREGEDDNNYHNIFYQKDTSINFYTGRQNSLNKNFSILHDGSLGLKPIDFTQSGYGDYEPSVLQGVVKIFANKTDNSLYYYTKPDASTIIKKKFVGTPTNVGATPSADGEDVILKSVTTDLVTVGNSSLTNTTLTINGLVIDLDNLITEYDYWSDSENTISLNDVATDGDSENDILVTPTVTLDAFGGLIPSDASLLDVVVLLRWRLTSNDDTINANNIQTGDVKIKKTNTNEEYAVLSFVPGSYYTPAGQSASGDMLIRSATVANLSAFKTLISGGATFQMLLNDINSEFNNFTLRDFSWGIRLYWR